MSKRILLIDSDQAFAQGLSNAITARGFDATLATDSERGMSLAREETPDLIVVCVEAQPTNGYMLCTRLKKDEQLKGIPVILTSANATQDSFEKHKKLKTRAEEYLIKPFEPKVMLERANALLGLAPDIEEEFIQVEDEPLGLGDLVDGEDEPISLSDAEAAEARNGQPEEALVVEEVEEEIVEVQEEPQQLADDDDLDMFDRAFDSLGGTPQPPPAPTTRFDEPRQGAAGVDEESRQPTELSAPDDDAVLRSLVQGEEPAAVNDADLPVALDPDLPAAGEDLDARVAELEQRLAEREAELEHARKGSASTTELIRAKEAKNRAEKEIVRLREELTARDRELVDLHEQQTTLEADAQHLKEEAVRREAAMKALQQRADGLSAAAKKFERELSAAREEVKKGGGAEELRARVAALEKELETARTEMAALSGEKDLLGEERDDLRKQLEEAQSDSARNEDRAVKAYGRIKSEEMLREKAKKALQIALQLLEENPVERDEVEEAAKQVS
ncbi:MAG: response regulator [Deltaproteobacteria bacterium]